MSKTKLLTIIILITSVTFLYSNEVKVINYLKASRITRNIGYSIMSPAIIFTSAFVPLYKMSNYMNRYSNLYNSEYIRTSITYFKEQSELYNTYSIISQNLSWSFLGLGVALDVSTVALFISSNLLELKARKLSKGNYDGIVQKLIPPHLHKKLFTFGLISLVNGSTLLLIAGTSHGSYFIIKDIFNQDPGNFDEYFVPVIVWYVSGAVLEITSIILLVVSTVSKKKGLKKSSSLNMSPVLEVGFNELSFGMRFLL